MADNPLFTNDVPFAINTFIGDGTTSIRNVSFAGGYISKDHIKAFQTESDGETTEVTLTWIGDFTVQVSPVTPDDIVLTIYRDTPKGAPTVNFVQGAVINEPNLDELAEQSVFVSAELSDRFQIVYESSEASKANADEALVVSEEAADTASIALGNSETALLLANTTAAQFASLSDAVEDIVGGDVTNFAVRDGTNIFSGPNEFIVAPTVPTQTSSDDSTKAASTAFVQAKAATTLAAAATDATTKANAAQAAAALDASSKASFVQGVAAADATTKANAAALAGAAAAWVNPNVTGSTRMNVVAMNTATNIDVSSADVFTASRAVNTTYTFSGATAGKADVFIFHLNLSSGAVPTFPGTVTWYNGTPVWANGKWTLGFLTVDGGASWIGTWGFAA